MTRHPTNSGNAGFTLIELMIVLVLLSLMLTILFSSLRLGARSWDAVDRKLAEVAERGLVVRFVEKQLALAMPVLEESDGGVFRLAFTGESEQVTWVSPLPAHRGGGGVQRMTLMIGDTDRGEGLLLSYGLFHPDLLRTTPTENEDAVLLLEGVSGLRMSYYGPAEGNPARGEWSDQWDRQTLMPELLRIELELDSAADERIEFVVEPKQGGAAIANNMGFGRRR